MRKNIYLFVAAISALILSSCQKDNFSVNPYDSSSDEKEEIRVEKAYSGLSDAEPKIVFYYTYDYGGGYQKKISAQETLDVYGDSRPVYFYAEAPDTLKWRLSETSASLDAENRVDFKWACSSGFQEYSGEQITGPASFVISYSNKAGDGNVIKLEALIDNDGAEVMSGECGINVKYARLRVKGFYHCFYEKKDGNTFYVHESLTFNVYYGGTLMEEGTEFFFTAGTSDEPLGLKTYRELSNVTEIDASIRDSYIAKWDPLEENPEFPYLKTLRIKARYGANEVFFDENYTGMDIERLVER